jgi:hypothetical protein
MPIVSDLFELQAARSDPFDDHEQGPIAFVTNGFRDNGIRGHVEPTEKDRVFREACICVSAFCEATVPEPPFIARGNGGSSLTILVPKLKMSQAELWGFAAYLSSRHGWKFSFGRMASLARLQRLEIPERPPRIDNFDPRKLVPRESRLRLSKVDLKFAPLPIQSLFRIESGDFHSVDELDPGEIPLISCGALDNGVIGFFNPPPERIYQNLLTVAYNGDYPLMAKYHPYRFAAKDDVAILHPLAKMSMEGMLLVQVMLNREVWRHSYGRKLYRNRLEKVEVRLPVTSDGKLNDQGIKQFFRGRPLWSHVGKSLKDGLPSLRKAALLNSDDQSPH